MPGEVAAANKVASTISVGTAGTRIRRMDSSSDESDGGISI